MNPWIRMCPNPFGYDDKFHTQITRDDGAILDCTIEGTSIGYQVVVYSDECGSNGYGDNAMIAYYHVNSIQEALAIDPRTFILNPWAPSDGYNPDHATRTGMYDHW